MLELLGVETKLLFTSDVALPFYRYGEEWYPVDINMLSLDFEAARSSGAKLEYALSSRDAQTAILREAWEKYPPLQFPELDPEDMLLLRSVDEHIEEERLSPEDSFKESVILGLRMNRGVCREALYKRYNLNFETLYGDIVLRLIGQNLLERKGTRYSLTTHGRRFANLVMAELV